MGQVQSAYRGAGAKPVGAPDGELRGSGAKGCDAPPGQRELYQGQPEQELMSRAAVMLCAAAFSYSGTQPALCSS